MRPPAAESTRKTANECVSARHAALAPTSSVLAPARAIRAPENAIRTQNIHHGDSQWKNYGAPRTVPGVRNREEGLTPITSRRARSHGPNPPSTDVAVLATDLVV